MQKLIENFFQVNFNELPKDIAVAVSGGVDSLALTFLLHEFCLKNKIKLHAITIDHKMRKTSSTEALQLNKLLKKHKINHQILALNAQDLPKSNIEAKLREARYSRLSEFCLSSKVDNLFLGHHQGDAAENFLIRLFRGSGLDGLSVVQEIVQFKNLQLCRPLLNTKKDDLKNYLEAKKIKWFEDETNADEKFLRNKIRKFLSAFEEKDVIEKRIVSAAKIIKESNELLDELMHEYTKTCLKFNEEGALLNAENYQKIPPKIAQKILALLLMKIADKPYKPRYDALQNFEKQILNLKKGQKRNFYGCMAVLKAKYAPDILIYRED